MTTSKQYQIIKSIWVHSGLRFFCKYSGLTYIGRKLNPKEGNPTFFIWFFSLYFAAHGIAVQMYENQLDRFEHKKDALTELMGTDARPQTFPALVELQYYRLIHQPSWSLLDIFKTLTHYIACGAEIPIPSWLNETLRYTDLRKVNLKAINLSERDLEGASLSMADLAEADLSEANLKGAKFHEAKLKDANLSLANLQGANLSAANLTGADLSGATSNMLIFLRPIFLMPTFKVLTSGALTLKMLILLGLTLKIPA